MEEQETKSLRVLSLYERLCKGDLLIKKDEAERFDVHEKTIQRDLETLRLYLEKNDGGTTTLEYNRAKKRYSLSRKSEVWLTKEEILALGKVLLETRAFLKKEMDTLLDKVIRHSEPSDRKVIRDVISNEQHYYEPLKHGRSLLQMIWDISDAVRTKKLLEISYQKETAEEAVTRTVKPVGVLFSEYYFYLAAFSVKYDFESPTIYRMDRITNYTILKEHFKVDEKDRFEEGEFRQQIQFMQSGPLMNLVFRFTGSSIQAVEDRLPTATKLSEDEHGTVFEAKVFGKGVKMWLLSQGPYVEVLKPVEFRDEMKRSLEEMLGRYGGNRE
ncbi:WYL domain-containing protein [Bacillus sp. S13(2024)]|uniref:helix-turn-helix transcriptional regulator n=1 Tax=unclassified Bacillus (in: firmicutes) TaxID=185979 RepID=UPI003D25E390